MRKSSSLKSSTQPECRGDMQDAAKCSRPMILRFGALRRHPPSHPDADDDLGGLWARPKAQMTLTTMACLCVIVMASVNTGYSMPAASSEDDGNLDLAILVDDVALQGPGCDQLTAYDVHNRTFVHQGAEDLTRTSPGRTTFDRRYRRFLSVNANYSGKPPFLTMLQAPGRLGDAWSVSWIEGAEFLQKGDIAFLQDDDHFLVSEGFDGLARSDEYGWIAEYRVSDFRSGTKPGMWSVGSPVRRIQTESLPALLRLSQDKETLHIVESPGRYAQDPPSARVRSFRLPDFQEIAPPIDIGKVSGVAGLTVIQAALLPDSRTLLVNEVPMPLDAGPRYLVQVDLLNRSSSRIKMADNKDIMATVGGIAYNHAVTNHGLIAIHGGNEVSVYVRAPDGSMHLQGAVSLPWQDFTGYQSAPWLDLEWSFDGQQIVAARHAHVGDDQRNFVIIDVSDNGRGLAVNHEVASCLSQNSRTAPIPMEVITANQLAAFIAPTSTPSPQPEQATCVCDIVRSRVPIAVINDAVANPESVEGWQQPLNPNLPVGPNNPRRHCLGLKNPNVDFHPLFNKPIWLVGCP